MLSIAHTIISLPLGIYLQNPFIIFLAAFILHILADTLLHWNIYPDDHHRYPVFQVATDIISGLIIAWLLLNNQLFTTPILAAIAGGNGPDILHGLWDLLGPTKQNKYFKLAAPFFSFHDHVQLETYHIGRGLVSQIILVVIAILMIM